MSYGTPPPPPPPGYGPGAPLPPGAVPPNHPQAVLILVLGIVGLLCCSLAGIAAWILGNKAQREIEASNGQLGGAGMVKAGKILGIIAVVLMIVGIVAYAILFATSATN